MVNTYHPRGKLIDGYAPRDHPSYISWSSMKYRCNDRSGKHSKLYFDRGISYCDEWEHFENFARDMGIRPGLEFSLDRIDNNDGYKKENCRWATRSTQSINRRVRKDCQSGETGIITKPNGRFSVKIHRDSKTYSIPGSFSSVGEAAKARDNLLKGIDDGKDTSHLSVRKARHTNKTGIRGISCHKDGGFVIRWVLNGKSHYIGYSKTIEEAKEKLEKWKLENS